MPNRTTVPGQWPWGGNRTDQELSTKLQDSLSEVDDLRKQVENLTVAEAEHLQRSKGWDSAIIQYTALVALQEKRLKESTHLEEEQLAAIRKKLWSSHHNLGYVFFRKGDLLQSEVSLRQAYDGRYRELGKQHTDTMESMRQLCKVLRRMGPDEKLEAEHMYFQNWRVSERPLSDFAIENGFQLGTLYQDQGHYGDAEGQLRKVWQVRKDRRDEFQLLLKTAKPLTEVLLQQKKDDDRVAILKYLWGKKSDPLSGWMVDATRILADHYWTFREYAKAKPFYEALWKFQTPRSEHQKAGCKCESCHHSQAWFKAGCRYAVCLSRADDRNNWLAAEGIFDHLKEFSSQAPRSYYPTALTIDWEHASNLLQLDKLQECSKVYKRRWTLITESDVWEKKNRMLDFGFGVGHALKKAGRLQESENVLQQIFNARKALITPEEKKTTTEPALKVGEQLHTVLTTSKLVTKARKLRKELDDLKVGIA